MKRLIVDYGLMYNRIAMLENDQLVELYIEDTFDRSLVGNVYLGKVVNVVKSMAAAFVDIGQEKNAYLPWNESIVNGSEIIVQVRRDPVGDKGATVTRDVSISGQYIVLLPFDEHVMVSKKIRDTERIEALKAMVHEQCAGYGAVIRTEAAIIDDQILLDELHELKIKWEAIDQKRKRILQDRLIHLDYSFNALIIKEYLPQVEEMYINDPEMMKTFHQQGILFKEPYPIFEHFKVESQILESLKREVKLHQGSMITIDETEALTAIDVNSGQFTGSNNKEETFLQVNLAAAREIARQIRLRNVSGIIIIDFINMKQKENYDILMKTLKKYFRNDRCQPQIHGMTALGLMEVTRKKNRKSLKTQLVNPCETCGGSGYYISETVYYKKFIEKMKSLKHHTGNVTFTVEVSDLMLELLSRPLNEDYSYLEFIENELNVSIIVEWNESLEEYNFKTSGK